MNIDTPTSVDEHSPKTHEVLGHGGVALAVYEWGNPEAPAVLLVHGLLSGHCAWEPLAHSAFGRAHRLVAVELRGHAGSGKPDDPGAYASGEIWADDLAAVIAARSLTRPLLIGWSYGASVVMDYVRLHGTAKVSGIALIGGATEPPGIDPSHYHPATFALFEPLKAPDPAVHRAGVKSFLRAMAHTPLADERFAPLVAHGEEMTGAALGGIFSRAPASNADVLASLDIPLLVLQGDHDSVVTRALAEHVAATGRGRLMFYEGIGHMPHLEATDRVSEDLVSFAAEIRS